MSEPEKEYQRIQNQLRQKIRVRDEILATVLVIACVAAIYLGIGAVIDALPVW